MMDKKKCYKCFEILPVEFFYKNRSKKLGFSSYCKTCAREADKTYRKTFQKTVEYKDKQAVRAKTRRLYRGKEFNCCVLGCLEIANELHHIDYTDHVGVLPLCNYHHKIIHRD